MLTGLPEWRRSTIPWTLWCMLTICIGRSLNSCKAIFDDIRRAPYPYVMQAPITAQYSFPASTFQSTPGTHSSQRKRPLSDSEGPPQTARILQPRPSFAGPPILSATSDNESVPSLRPSPFDTPAGANRKKKGRPSNEEIARRRREAEAQGGSYEPKKRTKKPKPNLPEDAPAIHIPAPATHADPPTSLQTPQPQAADLATESSSGRRRRQKQREQGDDTDPHRLSNPMSKAPPLAESPSDRLRPEAQFGGRISTNPPGSGGTAVSSSDVSAPPVHADETKGPDPSTRMP